ncbi:hypothetical protein AX16_000499 [Volvariella volvacea WC 439]|nr:hypothetical protein AX16_000499 [Volvariella volvacea WC 439]
MLPMGHVTGILTLVIQCTLIMGYQLGYMPPTQYPFQGHGHGDALGKPRSPTWKEKYGDQIDLTFTGPLSFSHLPYKRCLEEESEVYDIALLGIPFDTGVTHRNGARFGPYAIRSGSRRQRASRGFTLAWGNNPYDSGLRILDCGDVPVSPFDNALAVDQIEVAYSTLLGRPILNRDRPHATKPLALDGLEHPRIVSLGGDHTIVLPILRSLHKIYGPISVIHFDAHLDTWDSYAGQLTEQSRVTHGTFFHLAREEGLLSNQSIHAGIRCKLAGMVDIEHDEGVGFQLISTDDIDDLGPFEIVRRIRQRVGNSAVYLSLDIDVIDPGLAPATGTPEAGGWTVRELKRILRGLAGLNFVGADIVEVAPAYDHGIKYETHLLLAGERTRYFGEIQMRIFTGILALLNLAILCSLVKGDHHRDTSSQGYFEPRENAHGRTARESRFPTWKEKYGEPLDYAFTGPLSFSHLPYKSCLAEESETYDIALLGIPFDTAVTYRTGARFGPYAIRSGSRRQQPFLGYSLSWGNNPYLSGLRILDCGDIPVSPFDNALAMEQIEVAYSSLLGRTIETHDRPRATESLALDGVEHPRIVSLGGDHTIVLPILRSLNKIYGPISVIHFDAHLDTWNFDAVSLSEQSRVTHGSFFHLAREEGLLSNSSIHAGIRCKLTGLADIDNDERVGFQLITTDAIDDLGPFEIIRRIRERVGNNPVYLSLDIDVIDPGLAPATGTPEAGGWTVRELKRILRGLSGLNFVGADIVEVSPAYDHAEITGIAAANLVHDFLSLFLSTNSERGNSEDSSSDDSFPRTPEARNKVEL